MTATFPPSGNGGPETDPVAQPALAAHIADEPAHGGDLAGTARPPTAHTHDDRYYTEAEVDALLAQVLPSAQTADYTFALTDAGKAVEVTSASARTVTVPADATVAFPVGTVIEVGRFGAGTVAISPAAGVTLRSAGGVLSLRAQYSTATLRKRASDEWSVAGDLA